MIIERARAKLNLTLTVLGRRADGYHALTSLVSFADVADTIALAPGTRPEVRVDGPFAGAIVGENLLTRTIAALQAVAPDARLGSVHLTKRLPVAAGVGGGSADAAALLRALRAANPDLAGAIDWFGLARGLGADVPVCLADGPALMSGIGDDLQPLASEPGRAPIPAVLVNPRVPLATREVFAALGAPPLAGEAMAPRLPTLGTRADLIGFMAAVGNDLEAPALRLLPVVGACKAALARQPGCLIAVMSGSGPTCFGLYERAEDAAAAAAAIARQAPDWWCVATTVASP